MCRLLWCVLCFLLFVGCFDVLFVVLCVLVVGGGVFLADCSVVLGVCCLLRLVLLFRTSCFLVRGS